MPLETSFKIDLFTNYLRDWIEINGLVHGIYNVYDIDSNIYIVHALVLWIHVWMTRSIL